MNKQTKTISRDMEHLADDARALLAATAHVTGEKVAAARKSLKSALNNGRSKFDQAEEETICEARAAMKCLRDNPRVLTAARKAFRSQTNPSHTANMIMISSISLALFTKCGSRELVAKRIVPPAENTKNPR